MPRRTEPASYETRLIESVADDIMGSADRMAAEQGAPPDTEAPSERRKVALWGRSDPAAPHDQIMQMLMTTGVPPEQMAQMQLGRLAKSHPDLVQAFAAPIEDEQLADRLATLAEYWLRVVLLDHLDPDERVREAERLNRLWMREQGLGEDDEPEMGGYG